MAHLASHSFFDDFEIDETPSIIEDVLYEDHYNCNRGLGITSPLGTQVIIDLIIFVLQKINKEFIEVNTLIINFDFKSIFLRILFRK